MIQRGGPWILSQPGMPRVLGKERSVLGCGCYVLCGIRLDNHEVATAAVPCCGDHEKRMREWRDKMKALPPSGRELIDVVEENLTMFEASV